MKAIIYKARRRKNLLGLVEAMKTMVELWLVDATSSLPCLFHVYFLFSLSLCFCFSYFFSVPLCSPSLVLPLSLSPVLERAQTMVTLSSGFSPVFFSPFQSNPPSFVPQFFFLFVRLLCFFEKKPGEPKSALSFFLFSPSRFCGSFPPRFCPFFFPLCDSSFFLLPSLRSLIFSGFIARECQASLQLKRLQSHYCRNHSCGRRRRRRRLISKNGAVCAMGMTILNLVTEVLKSCNQALL